MPDIPHFSGGWGKSLPLRDLATSRITRTYDFLRIKDLLDPGRKGDDTLRKIIGRLPKRDPEVARLRELRDDLRRNLQRGRAVDWTSSNHFSAFPTIRPGTEIHDPWSA